MPRLRHLRVLAAGCLFSATRIASQTIFDAETCPGGFNVSGYGRVELVATKWNLKGDPAAKVEVIDGKAVPNLKGRAYFSSTCQAGKFSNQDYMAMPLLGKTLTFTVDLSKLGCGCNAAMYLTSLNQNTEVSDCGDYYCDANKVCGVRCFEIDVMEANSIAFHSTLHTPDDGSGVGGGYGGGGEGWSGPRDWSSKEYGPNGTCINTSWPFQVAASFPVWAGRGTLAAMVMTLSQDWCSLGLTIKEYKLERDGKKHDVMGNVSEALEAGMTPIVSFWESDAMLWMDGRGDDGKGPCDKDLEKPCPATVAMHSFSVEPVEPWSEGVPSWVYIAGLVVLAVAAAVAVVCCMSSRSASGHSLLQDQ